MTNRRKFLRTCSALALTAGFAPAMCFSAGRMIGDVTLDQISFAAFSEQIGTLFKLAHPSVPVTALKLVQAKLTPATHLRARPAQDMNYEKFALLFCGPKDAAVSQDTHFFEHPGIGRFAMFIVPVRSDDSSQKYYQAVFNRPAPETST